MDYLQHITDRLLVGAESGTAAVKKVDGDDLGYGINPQFADQEPVELWWQITVMSLNVIAFCITMGMNIGSQYFMPYTLSQVTDDWKTQIDPAGWAFSIWGVIYFFLALFVIYQALPLDQMGLPGFRNDDMIYNQMNLIFVVNMLANAAWLPFFQSNTLWGFIVGEVLIFTILATNLALMVIAGRNQVWWGEIFLVRAPFSIYSGWVTAASILNTTYMLKSWGMADQPTTEKPLNSKAWTWADFMMFTTEENYTCVILWVAEIIYEVAAYSEKNPLFGSVFIWVMSAILENTVTNKSYNTNIVINASIILGIHIVSMAVLWTYSIFEVLQPWYEPLSFWDHGFLGKADYWADYFQDIKLDRIETA